jgi:hypothetical protein
MNCIFGYHHSGSLQLYAANAGVSQLPSNIQNTTPTESIQKVKHNSTRSKKSPNDVEKHN